MRDNTLIKTQNQVSGERDLKIKKWAFPKWDGSGHVIEQEPEELEEEVVGEQSQQVPEPELDLPTAGELQKIRDEAYQEGYASGTARGQEEGRQKGLPIGKKEGFELGKQEGLEAGKTQGHQQAFNETKSELDSQTKALTSTMQEFQAITLKQQKHMEQAMVSMVTQICRNLIFKELEQSGEAIQSIVNKAIGSLPEASEQIQIEVHPDQIENVLEAAQQSGEEWQVKGNDSLMPGGCKVTTSQSQIDYTLEHRFQQQLSALLAETELSKDVVDELLHAEVEALSEPEPEIEPRAEINPELDLPDEGPIMPGESAEQLQQVQEDIGSEMEEIQQLMNGLEEPSGFNPEDQPQTDIDSKTETEAEKKIEAQADAKPASELQLNEVQPKELEQKSDPNEPQKVAMPTMGDTDDLIDKPHSEEPYLEEPGLDELESELAKYQKSAESSDV